MIKIFFNLYHILFPSYARVCRYEPTCSKYMLDATQKYGLVKGIARSTLRVLSCHPLSKRPYFDPA